jgi:hypothetical protein
MSRLQEFAKRLRDREGFYKILIVLASVFAATLTSVDHVGAFFGGQGNAFLIATILAVAVVIFWVLAAVVGGRR